MSVLGLLVLAVGQVANALIRALSSPLVGLCPFGMACTATSTCLHVGDTLLNGGHILLHVMQDSRCPQRSCRFDTDCMPGGDLSIGCNPVCKLSVNM